ncbi:hypothetical protein [Roseomonas elaeocarpi]|uniref:PepSY domain-containing protein n=1 Tax=Roseomonas elaeocarpi TaxID=907779 RepID=A0ABV6JVD5_9PROT
MRSTISGLALAATLLASPVAFAQISGHPGSDRGTVGSPTAPGGGSTTLAQGTPGTSPGGMNSGNGAAPNTASPNTGMPSTATPRTGPTNGANAGAAMPSTSGPDAVGTKSPPTTATPASGANSFTEGQARSRIEAAGYSDVQGLKKDEQGVWRGQGMRNGQRVDVGLDFKGDVVTGSASATR